MGESVLERMERIDAKTKIASFIVKEKQPYEFKVRYAAIRAKEFVAECEARGLNYHVSVGGLDSITLFCFLKSIGINAPGISVSYLEDASIQEVHKELGIERLKSAVKFIDEKGKTIPNTGHMVFNWFEWKRDRKEIPKIHPAQKPVVVLKRLIEIFTDEGDVVIDPCCGSGTTLRAAIELGRSAYGFEINRIFYKRAKEEMLVFEKDNQMSMFDYVEV